METNIFIEISILRFILNKWKLKNKIIKKVARKKQKIGVLIQTLAAKHSFQTETQNLCLDLSKKILDSLTIG